MPSGSDLRDKDHAGDGERSQTWHPTNTRLRAQITLGRPPMRRISYTAIFAVATMLLASSVAIAAIVNITLARGTLTDDAKVNIPGWVKFENKGPVDFVHGQLTFQPGDANPVALPSRSDARHSDGGRDHVDARELRSAHVPRRRVVRRGSAWGDRKSPEHWQYGRQDDGGLHDPGRICDNLPVAPITCP